MTTLLTVTEQRQTIRQMLGDYYTTFHVKMPINYQQNVMMEMTKGSYYVSMQVARLEDGIEVMNFHMTQAVVGKAEIKYGVIISKNKRLAKKIQYRYNQTVTNGGKWNDLEDEVIPF